MKLRSCIASLLLLCAYGRLQGQNNFTITGTVLDAETHAAIEGAEIIDSARNHTLLTNANGGFVLTGLSNGQYINVTCTGYLSKHVIINGQSNLVVLLTPSVNQLDETIVIAYGKTTRRMNTGAISRVTAAVLDKQPVSNPLVGTPFKLTTSGRGKLTNGFAGEDFQFVCIQA
ncbi:carboxypeptidase-like regulatory domain-containing protein, partial [Parafilimonas terrae]